MSYYQNGARCAKPYIPCGNIYNVSNTILSVMGIIILIIILVFILNNTYHFIPKNKVVNDTSNIINNKFNPSFNTKL